MRKLLLIIIIGLLATDLYSEDYIPGEPGDSSTIGNFWKYMITNTSGDTFFVKATVYGFGFPADPDCTVVPKPFYRTRREYFNRDKETINTDSVRIVDSIFEHNMNSSDGELFFFSYYTFYPLEYFVPYDSFERWITDLNDLSETAVDTNISLKGKTYDSIFRIDYSFIDDSLIMRDYFIDSLGLFKQEIDFIDPTSGERKSYQLDLIEWETIYSKTGVKPGTGNPAHNYNEKQLRGMNKTGAPVNILGRRIPDMDMNDKKAVNVIYDPEAGALKQVFP